MPNVETTFTARADHLEAAVAKANAQILGLKEKLGQVRSESERGKDAFSRWAGSQTAAVGGIVMGWTSLVGTIGRVKAAYDEWAHVLDAAADKSRKYNEELVEGLALSGKLAGAAEVEGKITAAVAGGQSTREKWEAAYRGAAAGAPGQSAAGTWAITQQAMKFSSALGPENMRDQAELVGRVSSLLDKTPAQAANLVEFMRSETGSRDAGGMLDRGFLGGIRALTKSGAATPEEAIGIALTAVSEKMSPRIIESLAAKVSTPGKQPAIAAGHIPSADQRAQIEWVRKTPAERLQTLLADPNRMAAEGISGLDRMARISPADVRARAAAALAAESGGAADAAAGTLGQTAIGRQRIWEGRTKNAQEQYDIDHAAYLEFRKRSWDELEESLNKVEAGPTRRLLSKGALYAGQFLHEERYGAAFPPDSEMSDRMKEIRDELRTQSATNAAQNARVNGRE